MIEPPAEMEWTHMMQGLCPKVYKGNADLYYINQPGLDFMSKGCRQNVIYTL
jgi:hypothetical protein